MCSTSPLRPFQSYLGVTFITFRGPEALNDSLLGSRSRHCYAITRRFPKLSRSWRSYRWHVDVDREPYFIAASEPAWVFVMASNSGLKGPLKAASLRAAKAM